MPPRKRSAPGAETPEGNVEDAKRAELRGRARFRTAVATTETSYRRGQVVEADQAVVDAWVEAGWAEVVEE